MSFFSDFFNSKKTEIFAPLSGDIINIEDVPDPVFSKKIVGDGIAIKPSSNRILAPVNGTIGKIFETMHAFSIISEDNVELFIHFGIDTVKLKGEGFKKKAKDNQKVKIGDEIIILDLEFIKEKAESILTPVVISNIENFKKIKKSSGTIAAGQTVIITLYH
ncbi:PTS glucose transporter subunit IIA [Buchnera aphidicola str. APS (Acyrthosiphon pisum)]|uniref:PTS system glucose-specific EIIA component n=1 Tax=Buchnera aphidicola subsp. Acyrthosiphon pisum (strain APS) TaxID=107806 RepID=PTGA_BUCAI|nr:PTS glucose transporter subunit IIA [Buchnera aphidicola]Q9WXI7.1 RecName: Full=PTS system glucose-specific EIIA component; AltName: Full=EIIA-Glc; AltName: Full=EIII-Glc; AltName: Full=Glucose-specific phosphotransferase enzyme IIA component [Buchnera aphidicola str. APS (Acyrthosiphon pisum)]pir/B84937/ phosphotransferase system enzyme II (EC 2.7.1.69) IIA component [imported] - Buchnera sp. (strain APS) [Buchnera sp. (in: enterobacteria)]BAA76880.1 enzyme Glc-III [Buchnera aphidicola (Acyr